MFTDNKIYIFCFENVFIHFGNELSFLDLWFFLNQIFSGSDRINSRFMVMMRLHRLFNNAFWKFSSPVKKYFLEMREMLQRS